MNKNNMNNFAYKFQVSCCSAYRLGSVSRCGTHLISLGFFDSNTNYSFCVLFIILDIGQSCLPFLPSNMILKISINAGKTTTQMTHPIIMPHPIRPNLILLIVTPKNIAITSSENTLLHKNKMKLERFNLKFT
jgi:hypothetical protein